MCHIQFIQRFGLSEGQAVLKCFRPTQLPLWFLLPGTRHGQVWGVGSQAELSCHADIQTTGCSSPMQCQTLTSPPLPPAPISAADYSQMSTQATNQLSTQWGGCVPSQQYHMLFCQLLFHSPCNGSTQFLLAHRCCSQAESSAWLTRHLFNSRVYLLPQHTPITVKVNSAQLTSHHQGPTVIVLLL